jgi:hypothetical protein
MKYYEDKQNWGADEMELIQHGYDGGKTETYKIKSINPVIIWGEPRIIYCEFADSTAELKIPQHKIEKPKFDRKKKEEDTKNAKEIKDNTKKIKKPGK